jgi:hypothetical protein
MPFLYADGLVPPKHAFLEFGAFNLFISSAFWTNTVGGANFACMRSLA